MRAYWAPGECDADPVPVLSMTVLQVAIFDTVVRRRMRRVHAPPRCTLHTVPPHLLRGGGQPTATTHTPHTHVAPRHHTRTQMSDVVHKVDRRNPKERDCIESAVTENMNKLLDELGEANWDPAGDGNIILTDYVQRMAEREGQRQ
jgi:hypothetical protein